MVMGEGLFDLRLLACSLRIVSTGESLL